MNSSFKKSILTLALLSLAGCATVADNTEKLGHKLGVKNQTGAAATGGAVIGCAGGAVLGFMSGHGLQNGCALGALAGAAFAGASSYQKQLDAAHELVADLKAKQIHAEVKEKTIKVRDSKSKKTQQQKALDRLTISLPARLLESHDPDIVSLLKRATSLGSQVKDETVTFEISARKAEAEWVRSVIQEAIPEGTKNVKLVIFERSSNKNAALVITPIPVRSN